jgi:hypothetical protein
MSNTKQLKLHCTEMGPDIVFSPAADDTRVSYEPFKREWEKLQQSNAVQEVSSINIIAFKSSNIEYLIPKSFRVLFVMVVLLTAVGAIANRKVFTDSLSVTVKPTQQATSNK